MSLRFDARCVYSDNTVHWQRQRWIFRPNDPDEDRRRRNSRGRRTIDINADAYGPEISAYDFGAEGRVRFVGVLVPDVHDGGRNEPHPHSHSPTDGYPS